jgi:hypothetical protein
MVHCKILVAAHQVTQYHTFEGNTLHIHCCENLKPQTEEFGLAIMVLAYVQEMLGLNLTQHTIYPD